MRLAISAMILALVLTLDLGCNCSGPAEYVTFQYRIKTMTDAEVQNLSVDLASGNVTLEQYAQTAGPECSYAARQNKSLTQNGTLGDPGYNMKLEGGIGSGNLGCPGTVTLAEGMVILDFDINSGQGLQLGVVDNAGTGAFSFSEGPPGSRSTVAFSSAGLFTEFVLDSLDGGGYAMGSFGFLARNPSDPNDDRAILVYDGTFGVND